MLCGLLGRNWHSTLFSERIDAVDPRSYNDEMLLVSVSNPVDPQVRLHELLHRKSKEGRLVNRFFAAWQMYNNTTDFPPTQNADVIARCAKAVVSNRLLCSGWSALCFCPVSLLVLLKLRLGCVFSSSCCTPTAYLGCESHHLVCGGSMKMILVDDRTIHLQALRSVYVGKNVPVGFVPLFTFYPLNGTSCLAVAVSDSTGAAQSQPMQLTALRASLTHRSYKHLRLHWRCPLTSTAPRTLALHPKEALGLVSAVFRSSQAAIEWKLLSLQLAAFYSGKSTDAAATAVSISNTMADMAKLLPHACSEAVHRLLRFPLLETNLAAEGRFIYCLVSPFLGKAYVGAVGFKRPRSPYARLREHMCMVKFWASRASQMRYGRRAPGLYKAIAKIGASNVIQVILASPEQHRLAAVERSFIRQLSPVFNILGLPGDIALPRAVQRLFG